jgi:hypothetical protein
MASKTVLMDAAITPHRQRPQDAERLTQQGDSAPTGMATIVMDAAQRRGIAS